MKRIISMLIVFVMIISCIGIQSFAGYADEGPFDWFEMDDAEAFYLDFELTPEEVSYAVETFGIDPQQNTAKYYFNVPVPRAELENYYMQYMDYVRDDLAWDRLCELAHRVGLKNWCYFQKYAEKTYYHTDRNTGIEYAEFKIFPDYTRLKGMDFVYFTAKLFYAAGFADKYASYEHDYCYIYKEEPIPYPNTYPYLDTTYQYDVNYDGTVNIKDYKLFKQVIAEGDVMYNFAAVDQNDDGIINLKDLKLFRNYMSGNLS